MLLHRMLQKNLGEQGSQLRLESSVSSALANTPLASMRLKRRVWYNLSHSPRAMQRDTLHLNTPFSYISLAISHNLIYSRQKYTTAGYCLDVMNRFLVGA